MLSREDNERITRVGPGTPMGDLLRRYWLPAATSPELEADSAPIRVKLLGERLVAFRDSEGRVGLLEELCAHRCASLFLGRNEERGLRCVYHGWKYDVEGHLVDQPTEPPEKQFKDKVRLTAYPTVERGGLVWAYMGAAEQMPPPPNFSWAMVPESHRFVEKSWQECNWLQALEGGVDSFHVACLHRTMGDLDANAGVTGIWTKPHAVEDEVERTDYGHIYASSRPLPDGRKWVRVYQFVMPFHVQFALELGHGETDDEQYVQQSSGNAWVPMDDENTMFYTWTTRFGDEPITEEDRAWRARIGGRGPGEQLENYRKRRNKDVDWMIDREKQKSETFSGVDGIATQDHAVQESMGPIVDRTREHLGTTDRAVVVMRNVMLDAMTTVEEGGDPPGADDSYYDIFATERIIAGDADWRAELRSLFYRAAAE